MATQKTTWACFDNKSRYEQTWKVKFMYISIQTDYILKAEVRGRHKKYNVEL